MDTFAGCKPVSSALSYNTLDLLTSQLSYDSIMTRLR